MAALLIMAGEAVLSSFNERLLRSKGAIEPPDDVIGKMRWAYPLSFIVMGVEGALTGPAPREVLMWGLALFGFAKALKMWAIASLGSRWSYRVLVLPGAPLIKTGPYRFLSHPNYLAVVGEIVSVAAIVWAPITGVARHDRFRPVDDRAHSHRGSRTGSRRELIRSHDPASAIARRALRERRRTTG